MNVRRIQVSAEAGVIRLRLESGYATVPIRSAYELDPATALVLAHQIEAAIHRTTTDGLPLFSTPETQTANPS